MAKSADMEVRMIKLFPFILIFSLISCGDSSNNANLRKTEGIVSSVNPEGEYLGCSVESLENGNVKILCADGSEATLEKGKDGEDGKSCEVSEQVGGVLLACADSKAFIKHGVDGKDGSACSVKEDENKGGVLIECSDGSMAFLKNGVDGKSCELSPDPQGVKITCGGESQLVKNGEQGEQGESCEVYQESRGATVKCGDKTAFIANGNNGESCQVLSHPDGALVICGDSSVVVKNGKDGVDAVVDVVDPCGAETSFDEVLLVLQSGEIIAYFESGGKRYLTSLDYNKTYQTTDGTQCRFKITAEGEIVDL